jgi:hypothetical protein
MSTHNLFSFSASSLSALASLASVPVSEYRLFNTKQAGKGFFHEVLDCGGFEVSYLSITDTFAVDVSGLAYHDSFHGDVDSFFHSLSRGLVWRGDMVSTLYHVARLFLRWVRWVVSAGGQSVLDFRGWSQLVINRTWGSEGLMVWSSPKDISMLRYDVNSLVGGASPFGRYASVSSVWSPFYKAYGEAFTLPLFTFATDLLIGFYRYSEGYGLWIA